MSFFKGNYNGLKIISVLLAVMLWFYVSNEINPTTEQILNRVPLERRGLGADLTVVAMPGTVDLRIQGPRDLVQRTGIRAVEAFVDLSKADTGINRLPVQTRVPDGIRVVEIIPTEVEVRLETIHEKQVPISLQKTGTPARGYKLLEPAFDPARVILKGPKSLLDTIDRAVVKVNIEGTTDGFHGKMLVQIVDLEGNAVDENLITVSPQRVDVFVPVVLDLPSKVVPVQAGVSGEPAEGYVVSNVVPELASISIFGHAEILKGIDKIATEAIDVSGASADIYTDVNLLIPPEVNTGVNSIKVLVKIVPEIQ